MMKGATIATRLLTAVRKVRPCIARHRRKAMRTGRPRYRRRGVLDLAVRGARTQMPMPLDTPLFVTGPPVEAGPNTPHRGQRQTWHGARSHPNPSRKLFQRTTCS